MCCAVWFAAGIQGLAATKQSASKTAAKKSGKSSTAKSGKAPAAKSGKTAGAQKAPTKSKSATRRAGSSRKSKSRTARVNSQRTPEAARIQEIQQALAQRGYPCESSGVMDASTVAALKKFQEDKNINNLTGRGKLDSLTLIALGLGPQRDTPPAPSIPEQTSPPEGKNE
jgi:hypothetical protein